MKQIQIITLIAWSVIIVSSCEKVIDIEIEEVTPMIVMNAAFTPDSLVSVHLSRTRHILDNTPITDITNGTVEIYEGALLKETLSYGVEQDYRSRTFRPSYGVEYTVKARAESFNDAEASCLIPQPVAISSVDTATATGLWDEQWVTFNLTFRDDPDEENFYRLRLFQRSAWIEYQLEEVYDTLYMDPEKDTVVMGWTIDTVEIRHPFFEPYYVISEDLIVEEQNEGGIIFSDAYIKGEEYSFHGQTFPVYYGQDTATIYFYFESLSEDYFNYLKTSEKHYMARDNPFSVPVTIHNNIAGGLGVLGGYSQDVDSIIMAPLAWDDPFLNYED